MEVNIFSGIEYFILRFSAPKLFLLTPIDFSYDYSFNSEENPICQIIILVSEWIYTKLLPTKKGKKAMSKTLYFYLMFATKVVVEFLRELYFRFCCYLWFFYILSFVYFSLCTADWHKNTKKTCTFSLQSANKALVLIVDSHKCLPPHCLFTHVA